MDLWFECNCGTHVLATKNIEVPVAVIGYDSVEEKEDSLVFVLLEVL